MAIRASAPLRHSSGRVKALLRSGAPQEECRSAEQNALAAMLSTPRSMFDAAKFLQELLAFVKIRQEGALSYPRTGEGSYVAVSAFFDSVRLSRGWQFRLQLVTLSECSQSLWT